MKKKCFSSVIIIGAGPSGLAAAIQLRRYGIETLVIEKSRPGGLLRNAHRVENYPGFPDGISGPDLLAKVVRQAENHGAEIISDIVLKVLIEKDGSFHVITANGDFCSRYLIIASGTQSCRLPDTLVPRELAHRVFYEVADIPNTPTLRIALIGAGDAAFDYAFHLAAHHTVTIFNRSAAPKCLPLLWHRAQNASSFQYVPSTNLEGVRSVGTELILDFSDSQAKLFSSRFDAILAAIGRVPALEFLPENFWPVHREIANTQKLYFIGDVKNGIFRQTAIAAGDGIRAAMDIAFKIKENAE